MHITEYVGKDGVKTSEYDHRRLANPTPGDLILWPNEQYGRIESLHDPAGSWAGLGEAHVCCRMGSAFLSWNAKTNGPAVSISGGPFMTVKLEDLQANLHLKIARFWNWGDNSPGAGKGVDYHLVRPVFTYIGQSDFYAIRKAG